MTLKLLFSFLLIASSSSFIAAATLPSGFTASSVTGLANPTAMAFAPDGRLFVCLQAGQLRVIKNGSLLSTPFLTVTTDSSNERGLLGIAFDPGFGTNRFLYVYYTATSPRTHNRVSRFTANGDVVVSGSEERILDLENLRASNHNGGAIHFGPDGKLYIATGDNAVSANAQSLTNRLGKILRLNRDGTIPSDNPFFSRATGVNRAIWARGLRNPFTFAFQPGTGRMFINDVGAGSWEEINEGMAGANYGWPACEGPCSPANPDFENPIFHYGHGSSSTTGCTIVGAAFYNPSTSQFPSQYRGSYFFADYCSGWIRRLDPGDNNSVTGFASGFEYPVDLQVGPDGALYCLSRGDRSVVRISYSSGPPALQISRNGENAILSWPASAAGYSLQSAPILQTNPAWTGVGNPVTVVDGRNQVTVRITGSSRFFRLINP
jgi:glucose/arabinose dehydrogenase